MPKTDLANIGAKELKQLLEEIDLPRKDVARACKVSKFTVDRWVSSGELPQRHFNTLLRLRQNVVGELEALEKTQDKPPHVSTSKMSLVELIDEIESRGFEVTLNRKKG